MNLLPLEQQGAGQTACCHSKNILSLWCSFPLLTVVLGGQEVPRHTNVIEELSAASVILVQTGCWGHLLIKIIENCCWRGFWVDSHSLKG